uniref:Uncharacterized protein n=1 Tax=Chromera velia CCMP2878 TaxID=1169474 RepID=A0A0G4GYQ5_9ALVE|eukprot:Cvel_5419.t1-p1 / transcript=Cvel_5419.t1 / gene=Cvel_5419 / organism=Chromera_velia_CCMP2878 / gene_product=hypothetical protein / transcript_product=hypothetical protein / location=Cvel_scaffold252:50963-52645(+) / protein_length=561 / sequence_SO=supercontig / SO=protein_coding / is_pseudo=false
MVESTPLALLRKPPVFDECVRTSEIHVTADQSDLLDMRSVIEKSAAVAQMSAKSAHAEETRNATGSAVNATTQQASDQKSESAIPTRKVAYCVVETGRPLVTEGNEQAVTAPETRLSGCHALLMSVPLGGTKELVWSFLDALEQVPDLPQNLKIICVDRPTAGDTDPAPPIPSQQLLKQNSDFIVETCPQTDSEGLQTGRGVSTEVYNRATWRLYVSVRDALEVLLAEGVSSVHVLGKCLGHPQAAAFCHLFEKITEGSAPELRPQLLLPLTLITPWASCQKKPPSLFTLQGMSHFAGSQLGETVRGGVVGALGALGGGLISSIAHSMPQPLAYEKLMKKELVPEEFGQFDEANFRDFSRHDDHGLIVRILAGSAKAQSVDLAYGCDPQWMDAFVGPLVRSQKGGHLGGDSRRTLEKIETTIADLFCSCPPEFQSPSVPQRFQAYMHSAATVYRTQAGSWVRIWGAVEDKMVRKEVMKWTMREYGLTGTSLHCDGLGEGGGASSPECDFPMVKEASRNGLLMGGGPMRDAWLSRAVLRDLAQSFSCWKRDNRDGIVFQPSK